MKSLTIILLPLILYFGCTKNDASLNTNQEFDYSIEQSVSCFCPKSNIAARLFVTADTIADAVWLSDNTYLNNTELQRYRTIKGLLEEIELWDSSSTFQVSVTYDSEFHYPSLVSILPKPIVINDSTIEVITDAGVTYRTWNYIKYE